MIRHKTLDIDESVEVPQEVLDEVKLTVMRWERNREKSGIGNLSELVRIAQLEMMQAQMREDYYRLKRAFLAVSLVIVFHCVMDIIISIMRSL